MKNRIGCPDRERLQDLLDSDHATEEQSDIVAHLDSCDGCQHVLEEMATGSSSAEFLRHLDQDKPPVESAFWRAMQQIENEPAAVTRSSPAEARHTETDEELQLDFLQPSDSPEYLGRLGHFEVERVIGQGGMGVVLKGFDRCLQRYVALKVLDPKLAHNDVARKRFCREARAAAQITHENVIAIHQVDEEDSKELPYLVMQLVSGESLQDRIDRAGPLELRDILRVGAQAAAGLTAAHSNGLIHRDIKPANILLDGGPERVKLTDFGLARAAEDAKLTQTGFVAGTPLYMAPEQAKGETVDHRSDLFSLGSVLYAMATGRPPFEGNTPFLVLRRVTEEQPKPIHELNPKVPQWLGHFIDKLMAKDPKDRFQSAAEVAELLSQALARVQFSSGDIRCPEAARKARVQRRKGLLALGAGIALLGAGLFFTERFGITRFSALLGRGSESKREAFTDEVSPQHLHGFNAGAGPIWSVAFSPDGDTLAGALDDGTVKFWTLEDRRLERSLRAHDGPVWAVAFSPDGTLMATASDDGTAKLWDWKVEEPKPRVLQHNYPVRALAFSPDSKRLVTGTRSGTVRIWDTAGNPVAVHIKGHTKGVVALAYSPDGKTIASGSADATAKLWNAETGGVERLELKDHKSGVYSVAFSSDSETVATGSWDKMVRLWNVNTGEPGLILQGHTQSVWSVVGSPGTELEFAL